MVGAFGWGCMAGSLLLLVLCPTSWVTDLFAALLLCGTVAALLCFGDEWADRRRRR